MWQGAVGVALVGGLVSPDYTVAIPLRGVNPKYFEHLFRTGYYKTEINRYSHGIVPDRNRLYWDDFKQIKSILPPFDEQQEILHFLDRETAKIDTLIAKVREHIEKLKEYRTAIISAAVTGKIHVRPEVA
jgi:type I restriction enzyme S subunit